MRKLSVLLLLLAICSIATAREQRPEHPYAVSAVVSQDAQAGYVVVDVTVTEKATGKIVFHPHAKQGVNSVSSVLSDPIAGQPQFFVQIFVANGKADVQFSAFDRLIQTSHVSAM